MQVDGQRVTEYEEKPHGEADWVNGGFFVLSPKIDDYIDGDTSYWERRPMRKLVELDQLRTYHHDGFWQPMDSLRDRQSLEELWASDAPPWKMW